ncbi:hormone-sensitive lipase-like [Teleopsis dalmanni]|uniref:hormone-sensitive lipase-like n=1 Tax=Teleopsis dalmanni TaxID=139649 RepID=UPI000D32A87B|nr:hormone-sensitive lipase-like [Teleopsis dalmanni]
MKCIWKTRFFNNLNVVKSLRSSCAWQRLFKHKSPQFQNIDKPIIRRKLSDFKDSSNRSFATIVNYNKMTSANDADNDTHNDRKVSTNSFDDNTLTSSSQVTQPTLLPLYEKLLEQCQEQAVFFQDDSTERGQRLYAAFVAWQDFIRSANKLVLQIEEFAHKYDFDENTPGNGYRSFVSVTNACVVHGQEICKNLVTARSTVFFRKKFYMKEVESCSQLLSSLCTCLQYLLIMHEWSHETTDLFANGEHSAEELFEMGDTINQYCFYGRCLGFQYGDSIRGVLRFISIGMAGFSESFYSEDADGAIAKTTRSIWTGGKYFLNPELRARRIVNISQNAKIEFCKSFWFLAESELMHMIPSIVGSSIKVNRMIQIPAEPLQLPRVQSNSPTTDVNQNSSKFVDIPVPSSHLGPGLPVSVRLLSYSRREGMVGEGGRYRGWRKLPPRSPSILFHCHGGGFVAQSSKSHELYLRDWAVAIDAPILSIDYSLAPEAPFPRALEEVFYAYCWMLKNAEHLGTTAERVVLAGDSAGANLSIGVALKCIEMGVRIPDGIFLAYCPTLVSFIPSPARLLCLMDPLLPFGFMMRCLRAYASPARETLNVNAKHVEEAAEVRNAVGNEQHFTLNLDKSISAASSRRASNAKSPCSSLAENSKWDQIKYKEPKNATVFNGLSDEVETEDSSDTFASASYYSQTVEHTDLPSDEEDNSSCVSFEDDSQPIEHYPIEISANMQKNSDSEQYIDRFLDKYLIDTNTIEAKEDETSSNNDKAKVNGLNPTFAKTPSEDNLIIETGKEMIAFDSLQGCLNNAVNSISSTLYRYTQSSEIRSGLSPSHHRIKDLRNMDALIARSPSAEFQFRVPKDPFLSPYWASDEWLSKMPQTKILTLDMDPCLDDCVMFARKLKNLNRPVTLEILKGLPHGFLNFTMFSNEAMEGSKHCINCLKELLKLPD